MSPWLEQQRQISCALDLVKAEGDKFQCNTDEGRHEDVDGPRGEPAEMCSLRRWPHPWHQAPQEFADEPSERAGLGDYRQYSSVRRCNLRSHRNLNTAG
jgi:hypothetical protein